MRTQLPPAQLSEPLAKLQTFPQLPQSVSVVRSVSHPLVGSPSQSDHPASQVGTHVPAEQVVLPWALVQLLPQAPQLLVLVFKFASHPLLSTLSAV